MRMFFFGLRLRTKVTRVMFRIVQILLLLPLQWRTVSSGIVPRQAIPKFLPAPNNVTVHKGELAVLKCFIRNLGTKLVVWRKASDEHPLTIGEATFTPEGEISVDHEDIVDGDSRWNLLIKNVKPKHAGVYECQISAKGTYTHYVALNVLDKPLDRKPLLQVTGTEYVNKDSDINLTCNATGVSRAPEDVDWFFEGNRIHTSHPRWDSRIEILKKRPVPGRSYISVLIIHRSTMDDQGNYVCRSSDLVVNSMKVHVLKTGKDTQIKPRAPGAENEASKSGQSSSSSGARPSFDAFRVFIVIILLSLSYR